MSRADVMLWGTRVGAVALDDGDVAATFQYTPELMALGVELAPLTMPVREAPYRFPGLAADTFHGLPGLLADSLPDRFGNAIIAAWLRGQGRSPADFDPVERLSYTGTRGMGALEFVPALGPVAAQEDARLDLEALVELASEVLADREALSVSLEDERRTTAIRDILAVGTSAGGARAKAVIAFDPVTHEVRSGQTAVDPGFEHWMLKFDGVSGSGDRGLADPLGYTRVEYAYHLMAEAAGVAMMPCRLLDEGGRSHFMTRRFDRTAGGDKLHMQTLGGLAHLDYNQPAAHSYEEAFDAIGRLGLGADTMEEQYRRMVFNVVARNQDDHVKNIAFLMNRRGAWSLSPAYDLTYAYDPGNRWMARHQMSVNGRRDGFTVADLEAAGRVARLPRGRAKRLLGEVTGAVRDWPRHAEAAGVAAGQADAIAAAHRLDLSPR